jgi:hypothetical protein
MSAADPQLAQAKQQLAQLEAHHEALLVDLDTARAQLRAVKFKIEHLSKPKE